MLVPFIDASRKARSEDGSPDISVPSPNHEEPQKVIITQSIPAALRCCAIHLIPIIVSTTIMTLNIRGTYLGADLMSPVKSETINLMLFQLAAKGHEITIVASLGVIVLQYVRHELLFGDGLPLGLLGSGLTFNNFEFFFQKEFYGGLRYMAAHGNRPRKFAFLGLVMVAGLVATLAGPASAVLLVPKSQNWSAGGTHFFLNGTESHFWPDDLSGEMSELQQLCIRNNSTILGFCPGGGYHSLWAHWGTINSSTFQIQGVRSYAKDLSGSRFYWPVSSSSSLIPPLYALGDIQQEPNGRTSLIQPHAATVVVLQRLTDDWWKALRLQKGFSPNQVDDRTASAKFRNAITVARCAAPQKLRASDTTVNFPSIDGRFNFADSLPLQVDSLNATRAEHLRFHWVHLPPKFGAASIGGLFETPWVVTEPTEASRIVIGCTVQAGWVPATVFTDKYTFWTGWYPWNIMFGDRTPGWVSTSNNSTNGRIAFGDDWLNLLTPPAPITTSDIRSWQPSTIESIFLNAGLAAEAESTNGTGVAALDDWLSNDNSSWEKVSLVEAIVCSVVLDGLSRTGSYRVFNTSGLSSEWSIANYNPLPDFDSRVLKNELAMEPLAASSGEFITLEANMEISGFSLQRSLASFLAMSVLLTHIVIATVHSFYVIRKRHTSGSWATVGELIALSQNSQPAFEILANTGGGIRHSKTYAQVAKIRVKRAPGSSDPGRIELVFEEPPVFDGRQSNSSGRNLDDLRNRLLRHPTTWPKSHTRASLSTSEEVWGLSASTERLVPEISLEAGETTRVQLDHPYA